MPDEEMVTVNIHMPRSLHDELKERAHKRGITVPELMRRGVALDKFAFETDNLGQPND